MKNVGTGVTTTSIWSDDVYWSLDNGTYSADRILFRRKHSGRLIPNADYSVITNVQVPEKIFGTFYIYIKTDAHNEVYEHVNEGNNVRFSVS